jgi:site-specific DNA-methyltransferase (adenine-specific)
MTPLLTGRAHSALVNRIHHVDLFTLCDWLYEAGIRVDMVLMDLPYGVTAIKEWDTVIPFEPMWKRLKRVIKTRGAIVLTASQPFTSRLVCSNLAWFREELIWEKQQPKGFLDARRKHLDAHETVLVFADGQTTYNPQGLTPVHIKSGRAKKSLSGLYGKVGNPNYIQTEGNFPRSVLRFDVVHNGDNVHPTQKPVALFEYLIRTYTRAGELVLDGTCGSGTTAVAARNTQRQFVCGDTSLKYVEIARERLAAPYTLPLFQEAS